MADRENDDVIKVGVDTSDVKKASSDLDAASKSAENLNSSVNDVGEAFEKAGKKARFFSTETQDDVSEAEKKIEEFRKSFLASISSFSHLKDKRTEFNLFGDIRARAPAEFNKVMNSMGTMGEKSTAAFKEMSEKRMAAMGTKTKEAFEDARKASEAYNATRREELAEMHDKAAQAFFEARAEKVAATRYTFEDAFKKNFDKLDDKHKERVTMRFQGESDVQVDKSFLGNFSERVTSELTKTQGDINKQVDDWRAQIADRIAEIPSSVAHTNFGSFANTLSGDAKKAVIVVKDLVTQFSNLSSKLQASNEYEKLTKDANKYIDEIDKAREKRQDFVTKTTDTKLGGEFKSIDAEIKKQEELIESTQRLVDVMNSAKANRLESITFGGETHSVTDDSIKEYIKRIEQAKNKVYSLYNQQQRLLAGSDVEKSSTYNGYTDTIFANWQKLSDVRKEMSELSSAGGLTNMNDVLAQASSLSKQIADGMQDVQTKTTAAVEEEKKLERGLSGVAKRVRDVQVPEGLTKTKVFRDYEKELQKWDRTLATAIAKYDKLIETNVSPNSRVFQNLVADTEAAKKNIDEIQSRMDTMLSTGSAFTAKASSSAAANMKGSFDFGKAFSSVFKSGQKSFASGLKKELKGISGIVSRITSGFKKWRNEQKSLTDGARQMYKTFTGYLRMLRTRARRKIVAMIFEDAVSNIGKVAKMSPRFNKAISDFIVSTKTLGAQIIAGFEPIISFALPYITKLIDALTTGAQYISQFFAQLTGNDSYIKAKKGQYDYAASLDETTKSTKKANKAAKDYENTVLDFDQLHKLNGSDSDSDGLGIDDAVDLANAKNEANAFNEIADRIWTALNKGDFRGAGRAMGDGINASFAWLKDFAGWTANGEKITRWITNFGEVLKGMVDTFDPHIVGDAIGDVLNTGVESFLLLTDSNIIPYKEIGTALGKTFGEAVKTINWMDLGKGLVQGLQSAIKFMNGFIYASVLNDTTGEFESVFKLLGNAVSDLFRGAIETFNVGDWSDLLSGLTNGFFEFLANAFSDPERIRRFGVKVGETITRAFRNLNSDTIASGINALTSAVVSIFDGLIDGLDGKAIFGKLKDIFGKVDKKQLMKAIGIVLAPAIVSGVFGALTTAFAALPKAGVKLIGKLFSGLGKLFSKSKKIKDTASLGTFFSSLSSIATKFVGATAFIAIIAEIGLVLKEYASVVQDIANINIGENFSTKLKAVLGLAGTMTIVGGIITAITTGVSKSGIGAGGLLIGELLAGGFMLELYALAEVVREYADVVQQIASINIGEDYNSKLDKVLQLALGSTVLAGIITAIGAFASGSIYGGLAMAAGELLAGGILLEIAAIGEIIDGYVETVQAIANLEINESKYITNIQAIEAAVLSFTNLMLSEGWTALFQLPGQIATALDLTLINDAVDTIKQLSEIELPDSSKLSKFQSTAQSLLSMFSDDSGIVQSLVSGFTGLASNWSGSIDMSGVRAKFDMMVYMINALVGLSGQGVSTTTLQGSWSSALSAVEQSTVTSMSNLTQTVSNALSNIKQLFANSRFGLSIGVSGYGTIPTIKGYASGGVVGDGQMFVANEGGRAELIGGQNGHTVVVNNQQIISSVIAGVRQGVIDAMSQQSSGDTDGSSEIVLRIDSEDIARASLRGQRRINKRQNPLVSFG